MRIIFAVFLIIFIFIGALDHINAMQIVIDKVFGFAQSKSTTILSALVATAFTNAMTSNQYATTFIVGDAFRTKFDQLLRFLQYSSLLEVKIFFFQEN